MARETRTKADPKPATKAAQREDTIRAEYKAAGSLDGMVASWLLARKVREHYTKEYAQARDNGISNESAIVFLERKVGARLCELAIAREIRRLFPKSGVASLTAMGWDPAGTGDADG